MPGAAAKRAARVLHQVSAGEERTHALLLRVEADFLMELSSPGSHFAHVARNQHERAAA